MGLILNYLWRIWFIFLAGILTLLFFFPVYILSLFRVHYRYIYFWIRLWALILFYAMGFGYERRNLTLKKIEKNQSYVFISNHTSVMDIMLLCVLLPYHPLCFVGKKELEKIPIFGTLYKQICVTVDRNSSKSRAEVYEKCAQRMKRGANIVIFPEGGVPDDVSLVLDSFKSGAFNLAFEHRIPVAIFTFLGWKKLFPFQWGKGRPGRVEVFFNDVIFPQDFSSALEMKEFCRNQILSTLEK